MFCVKIILLYSKPHDYMYYVRCWYREIEGVVYPGVIKEREAAKSQYDKAKRKGQSAGHISTNK